MRTDHSELQRLHSFKKPAGQVARWLEKLSEYNYDIEHRPGKNHNNADSLSRYPVDTTTNIIGVIGIPQPPYCWLPMMSNKEFSEAQLQDNCLEQVIQWLQVGRRPPQKKVGSTTSETRYYWSRFDELKYMKNIAYIETTNEDDTQQQRFSTSTTTQRDYAVNSQRTSWRTLWNSKVIGQSSRTFSLAQNAR